MATIKLEYGELEKRFSPLVVSTAFEIATANAELYRPSYYTSKGDFIPHFWVVASVAEALWRSGMR